MTGRWLRSSGISKVVAAIAFSSIAPTSGALLAYEGDHYAWTYYLALQVGFTERQAYQIASGAYAIDWDPESGPMPIGSENLEVFVQEPPAKIRSIWLKFHAFAEHAVDDAAREAGKRANADRLWSVGVAQRNPGPFLHFTQDRYAHMGWNNRWGHAPAAHLPDFPIWDPQGFRGATDDSVAALLRFRREVLGQETVLPGRSRVYDVERQVIAANPLPVNARVEAQARSVVAQMQALDSARDMTRAPGGLLPSVTDRSRVAAEQIVTLYEYLSTLGPDTLSLFGGPDHVAAVAAVRRAVRQDKDGGWSPGGVTAFPEVWFDADLPQQWMVIEFEGAGTTSDPRFPVEQPTLRLGEPEATFTEVANSPNGAIRVEVGVSYTLEGLADLDFLHPLPVIESMEWSDFGVVLPSKLERGNGTHTITRTIQRSRAELESGRLAWKVAVHAYGLEPASAELVVRLPPGFGGRDEDEPVRPTTDLGSLLAELRGVVGAAVGAGERALGACRGASDAISSAVGARASIQAQLDRLAAASVAATDETAELGALLDRARAAAARGNAAARELGPLRGEAGALRDALCESRGVSSGSASASQLAGLEGAANALYAEAELALAEVRSIADRVAGTGRGAGDATGDAAGILAALDQLESRLRTASGLAAEADGALAELGALRGRGSDLTQRVLTALESVRGGAGSPATRELDQLFARMEAAADAAAACDPRDARSAIEAELAELDALRSRARELARRDERRGGSGERERAEAAAALAALIADLEASVAAGELFRDSILERAAQGLTCADRPPSVPEEPSPPERSPPPSDEPPDADAPGDEAPTDGTGATGSGGARDGAESAAGARAEAGGSPSPGWTIDSGVRTVAGAEAPAPAATQPALPRSNPAADLVAAATAAFSRCDYVSALALADRAAAIDPGNPWVAANRARIATLAAQQTATANQLQVAQSLLGAGRLKEARGALVAAQRDAPGCMSGPIGTLVAEVNAASEERREANRTALSQGLGTLLGAIGQAATAVAASRSGVAAIPSPAATPGARAAGPGGGGVPAGQTAASCYLLDWGGTVSPQQFDAEFTRWYVQAKRMPQGFVYSITPVGSPDMDEAQHQQALAYLRQTVGADYVGPYRSAAAAWQAAQSRCPNVVRSPPG